MKELILSEIFVYPIKSLGGISLSSSFAGERGLKYDRRYLLVDESGTFLTQRDNPDFALLKLFFAENGFNVLDLKSGEQIFIPFEFESGKSIKVKIWDDICNAVIMPKEISSWFSDVLNLKCSLVYMSNNEKRIVEKKYIAEDHIVSFADAYPYLMIGQSSLDDLNSRLDQQVSIDRFRPNLVFRGGDPYEEDGWQDFSIGSLEFKAVKPCARCVITTTDQQTGIRNKEPLRTLSTYRTTKNKVMFGMNVVCNKTGVVSTGDRITLL